MFSRDWLEISLRLTIVILRRLIVSSRVCLIVDRGDLSLFFLRLAGVKVDYR